jgi:predicted AlkP superfamily pyrophosphatase or phosphodiesterase
MKTRYFSLPAFALGLFLIISIGSKAQDSKKIPSDKPKLIVNIIVSQFRQDYITRYWDKFSDDGFRRLVNRGTICKNTSYSYLICDKGVGTATIVTGSQPSAHGIIGENWYSDLKGKVVTSIYDETVKTLSGPFDAGKFSPNLLLSTTYSDELNLSNNFKSKVISVSLDPVSAVMAGGHTANAAYWFEIQGGNFITSSFYSDTLPKWVNDFNAKRFPDTYMQETWTPILPISQYTESLPDDNKYEEGYKNSVVFPYVLQDICKIYKKREEYSILNATPFGDNLVKDFAIQAIVNENLGADNNTDVLFLNFTSLEQIGNMFGPLSVEVEDAVLRLDKELAHFLSFLDGSVGMENTLILFTSEHGIAYKPEYLEAHKIPSGYFNSASAIGLLSSYLNNIYGKGDWIKEYHAQQIYLNRSLIESAKLSLSSVEENVANLMLQFQGVQNTITSSALTSTSYVDGVFSKFQNGFNQKRSGDVIINLTNGYMEKEGKNLVSFGNDSRVPLIWYGWKIGRKSITNPVDLTDIAPTLSVLLEISYPNSASGVPIGEIIN